MADLGNLGKASQDMIKELQKMQHQDQSPAGKGGDHAAKFNQVLNNSQVHETQNLQKVQEASQTSAASNIQAVKTAQINQQLKIDQTRVNEAKKPSMFTNAVKELTAGQNKMDDIMKVALSGQKLSNQEMIGIQAGVYMYSQQMELVSKVVDKAMAGIKQAMNTQV